MQHQFLDTLKIHNTPLMHEYTKLNTYFQKTTSPDLIPGMNIYIRRAQTCEDLEKVFEVRWQGYKKYFSCKNDCIDNLDFSPQTILLLAEDEHHNPVGTLRIIDRRYGNIELDKFIDVDSLLPEDEKSCIEATRFSIPKHPDSKLIKHLLWKSALLYCQINRINIMIKSVRPCAARAYRALLFENVGPAGIYNHTLLGNLEHHTYKLNISKKRNVMKQYNRSLYDFFFVEDHRNINVDDRLVYPERKID